MPAGRCYTFARAKQKRVNLFGFVRSDGDPHSERRGVSARGVAAHRRQFRCEAVGEDTVTRVGRWVRASRRVDACGIDRRVRRLGEAI